MPMPKDTSRELPLEIVELLRVVNMLDDNSRKIISNKLDAVVDASVRSRQVLSVVKETLDQLRMDMKYIIFDLEATRRERDEALNRS